MAKAYYKVIIARGSDRADVQLAYYIDREESYVLAKDAAEALADMLTLEHKISPDKYWVAYMALITEEELFRDPRLDPSIAMPY